MKPTNQLLSIECTLLTLCFLIFLFATFSAFGEISEIVINESGKNLDKVIPMTPDPVPKSRMLSLDFLSN